METIEPDDVRVTSKNEKTKNLIRGRTCDNCKYRNSQSTACLVDVDFENKQNWEDAKKFPKENTCEKWAKRKALRAGKVWHDRKTNTTQIFDGTLWLEMK